MKTRLAVYSRTRNFWGGSFQYAKAVTEALENLDKNKYDIQVWHENDEQWNEVCSKKNFGQYVIDEYTIPPAFAPAARKIYDLLQKLPQDAYAERQKLINQLYPFSGEAKLDEFNPQIVICPQMGNPRFHNGAKHIGVIHDLMHRYESHFPEVGTPGEIAARENLFNTLVSKCDVLLVDSKIGKQHTLDCYPKAREDQIKILPFTAFPEIIEAVPKKPEWNVPQKYILYPAQFWLHKNHVGLARAMASLKEKYPDLVIVAAGNTNQNGYKPFMEIVEREGLASNFILPGYVDACELNWLYRNARAMIMPTYLGPTNIPPLEAMALGCPVAVSGIYGMPDQCGNAALYFNPANHEEIAGVMEKLWTEDSLCLDFAEKGKQRHSWYNMDNFAKLVTRIVEQIA